MEAAIRAICRIATLSSVQQYPNADVLVSNHRAVLAYIRFLFRRDQQRPVLDKDLVDLLLGCSAVPLHPYVFRAVSAGAIAYRMTTRLTVAQHEENICDIVEVIMSWLDALNAKLEACYDSALTSSDAPSLLRMARIALDGVELLDFFTGRNTQLEADTARRATLRGRFLSRLTPRRLKLCNHKNPTPCPCVSWFLGESTLSFLSQCASLLQIFARAPPSAEKARLDATFLLGSAFRNVEERLFLVITAEYWTHMLTWTGNIGDANSSYDVCDAARGHGMLSMDEATIQRFPERIVLRDVFPVVLEMLQPQIDSLRTSLEACIVNYDAQLQSALCALRTEVWRADGTGGFDVTGTANIISEPVNNDMFAAAVINTIEQQQPSYMNDIVVTCSGGEGPSSVVMKEIKSEKYEADHSLNAIVNEMAAASFVCFGLQNVGNTCYLNSTLQLLWRCVSFATDVVQDVVSDTMLRTATSTQNGKLWVGCVLFFSELVHYAQRGQRSHVVVPDYLVCAMPPPFNARSQEDAGECLKTLLNTLNDTVQRSSRSADGRDEPLVERWLGGRQTHEIFCTVCSTRSCVKEDFWDLPLPVTDPRLCAEQCRSDPLRPPSSIQALVDAVFGVMDLESDGDILSGENAYSCDVCKTKTVARRRSLLSGRKRLRQDASLFSGVSSLARDGDLLEDGADSAEGPSAAVPLSPTSKEDAPPYLILQLNRFVTSKAVDGREQTTSPQGRAPQRTNVVTISKDHTPVVLSETLLMPFMAPTVAENEESRSGCARQAQMSPNSTESRHEILYKLVGVVLHLGSTPHSGHYMALIRTMMDQWTLCNDSAIRVVTSEEKDELFAGRTGRATASFGTPYLLLYEQCTDGKESVPLYRSIAVASNIREMIAKKNNDVNRDAIQSDPAHGSRQLPPDDDDDYYPTAQSSLRADAPHWIS